MFFQTFFRFVIMPVYYSLWKFQGNKFDEPILYDYTFPVRFPNVVFRAKNLKQAKKKIDKINSKLKNMDRFDSKSSTILRSALS